ncbi:MAG: hypothetical protein JWQ73_680 [Variovorax sp.]|jgi:pimeloyl-ACP methyl ester carboxylesterase|nr:hypothetical protein [Variovorax sp.]
MPQAPFVREAGAGPAVICLHSNASSSAQWRGLMDSLSPNYHVFAPDSYGAGKSPEWPSAQRISLSDELRLLDPVFAAAGRSFTLVGHSYGAAIALIAALAYPGRVRAIALYEPTLFSLLDAESPSPNQADGIRNAVLDAGRALDTGAADAAAECFIDYWMGAGSWQLTPSPRKPAIAASMTNVRRWAHALFTEPTSLEAFRALDTPVLYMAGKRSTASALGVARLLSRALPRVEVLEFNELGHMGPITDPDAVNGEILKFLSRT